MSDALTAELVAYLDYAMIHGADPSRDGLRFLTQTARAYEAMGYSDHNTFILFGADMIRSAPDADRWAAETPAAFIREIYPTIFHAAPEPGALAWLEHDVAAYTDLTGSYLGGLGATFGAMVTVSIQSGDLSLPIRAVRFMLDVGSANDGGI